MVDEFRFCFTLDTEPDDLWVRGSGCTFESFRRLPEFHRSLVEAGARPTYLTTSEVAESPQARDAMLEILADGHCEVGAHFHTWTRRWPFPVPDLGDPPLHAMAHRIGEDVEQRMLAYTCEALEKGLGVRPRSYRGGRWSLGPGTARSLRRCGIRVDSTITPGLSWRDMRSPYLDGPDFRSCSPFPHFLPGDVSTTPDRVVELPVGAGEFPGLARGLLRASFARRSADRLGRALALPLGHRWLRPTRCSQADMAAVMRQLRRRAAPVWVFMIHSSEIVPCKPLPTRASVEAFVERCLGAIQTAVQLGARPATLSEAADWARQQGFVRPSPPEGSAGARWLH